MRLNVICAYSVPRGVGRAEFKVCPAHVMLFCRTYGNSVTLKFYGSPTIVKCKHGNWCWMVGRGVVTQLLDLDVDHQHSIALPDSVALKCFSCSEVGRKFRAEFDRKK